MDQKILELNIATKQTQNLTKATKETKAPKATKERSKREQAPPYLLIFPKGRG